jgi:prevent-host-death family protein
MEGVPMTQATVGIRELKARLSAYMRQVKDGATLVITERGKPIGRIVPLSPSVETRVQELAQAGLVAWNGRKLVPRAPLARTRGERTVADLLLDDRE